MRGNQLNINESVVNEKLDAYETTMMVGINEFFRVIIHTSLVFSQSKYFAK